MSDDSSVFGLRTVLCLRSPQGNIYVKTRYTHYPHRRRFASGARAMG